MARKPIYDEKIKPHLEKIREWAEAGVFEKDMYQALGVSKDTWERYKKTKSELKDSIKRGRQFCVSELYSALKRKAVGGDYQESKVFSVVDAKGNRKEHTEIIKKHALPDTVAIHLLLKNWDKENWNDNPALIDLRQEELKLRERMAEISEYK